VSDEWAIGLLAGALSIGFFIWFETHGLTTAFNDARSRELIARRVLTSRTPGLGQLGTTWPPLLSMLMLPTIWNNTLFRNGLAGSLPSMLAYVVAAVYVYRTARLITSSRGAGWVAAAVILLNPSLLYMQSTPMSETASLAAFAVTIYYGLRAAHTMHAADIAKCAAAVAVGTLIRYEDWVLAIALLPVLAYVAWRRHGRALAEAWVLLYGFLAFAGCAAWVLYNWVIFHDPLLPFFYGQSSHTYYAGATAAELPARGHPWYAFEMYGLTVAKTAGWIIMPLAVLGLLAFLWRGRFRPPLLAVYLTLIPFGFYWLALYKGVNTESLPEFGTGPYYNIRFGLAMIPAVAVFGAVLTTVGPMLLRRVLVGTALVAVVVSGVIGLGLTTPFVLREAEAGFGGDTRRTGQVEAAWLNSHYHGGNILFTYLGDPSVMFYLMTQYGFSDTTFITDSNGSQFERAIAHPERSVRWIILDVANKGNRDDRLLNMLEQHSEWRQHFVLRKRFTAHMLQRGGRAYGAVEIYQKVDVTSAPGTLAASPALPHS
jgi:Dolichyl-phosphate-mannose-protein mannosyltransferase